MAGFMVGRSHPAQNYQRIGSYLYDTHTGKACAPFREAQQQANAANQTQLDPNDPWAKPLADAQRRIAAEHKKSAADMIPACGSE